ncbi:MAG: hypothetical protein DRP50_01250 [Thermotoga sp.]|nr:MAG: hypothetical protein DRP50_01250 [Thermotoga sp.]
MKKVFFLSCVFLLLLYINVDASAFDFRIITPSVISTGYSSAALDEDVETAFYNPAMLSYIPNWQMMFSYGSPFGLYGTNEFVAAISQPYSYGFAGSLALANLMLADGDNTDSRWMVLYSLSGFISFFSLGGQIGYVSDTNTIFGEPQQRRQIRGDIGVALKFPNDIVEIGGFTEDLFVVNVATNTWQVNMVKDNIPKVNLSLKLGYNWKDDMGFSLYTGIRKALNRVLDVEIMAGGELKLWTVSLRAGYGVNADFSNGLNAVNYDTIYQRITLGAGIEMSGYKVDYVYSIDPVSLPQQLTSLKIEWR